MLQASTLIERMIERKVSEHAQEKEERAKRENNLVLSGVEESKQENEEDQKVDDIRAATALLRDAIGITGADEALKDSMTIKDVMRIGKKGSYPRMLKVTIPEKNVRDHILKKSFKNLESINRGVPSNKKIYINRDLTYLERQEQRQLREELKAKRAETGDPNWIIRGKRVEYRAQESSGAGSANSE